MGRYVERKFSQSLCDNISRCERHDPPVTVARRELQIIDEKKAEIDRLGTRAHLFKGNDERKIEEERAHTLPLECWGFNK